MDKERVEYMLTKIRLKHIKFLERLKIDEKNYDPLTVFFHENSKFNVMTNNF
jgi:hypothetical protein